MRGAGTLWLFWRSYRVLVLKNTHCAHDAHAQCSESKVHRRDEFGMVCPLLPSQSSFPLRLHCARWFVVNVASTARQDRMVLQLAITIT
jgi:hypothetical protein